MCNFMRGVMLNITDGITHGFTRSINSQHRAQEEFAAEVVRNMVLSLLIRTCRSCASAGTSACLRLLRGGSRVYFPVLPDELVVQLRPRLFGVSCRDSLQTQASGCYSLGRFSRSCQAARAPIVRAMRRLCKAMFSQEKGRGAFKLVRMRWHFMARSTFGAQSVRKMLPAQVRSSWLLRAACPLTAKRAT